MKSPQQRSRQVVQPSRVKISASLLAADFGRLADSISDAVDAGVDEFHFDIMDGAFVPNLTFGPPIQETVRSLTNLPIDAHMMVRSPSNLIPQVASAGADIITIHIESTSNPDAAIDEILEHDASPAIAIRPNTPVSALERVADRIDRVLIMTVEPGFGGQQFLASQLPKITEVRNLFDQRRGIGTVEVAVDGGIKQDTIGTAARSGATTFVSGTGIYAHPEGVQTGVSTLRAAAHQTGP